MHDASLDTIHLAKGLEKDKELRESLSQSSKHKAKIRETTARPSPDPEVSSIPACGCGS